MMALASWTQSGPKRNRTGLRIVVFGSVPQLQRISSRSGLAAATRCNNAMDTRHRFRDEARMFLLCRPWVHHGRHRTTVRPAFPVRQGPARRVPPAGRRRGGRREVFSPVVGGRRRDPPRVAGRNGRSNAGLRGGRGGGTPRIQTVSGPTAWRRNILAIAWGFPDTAARTGVLSCGRGPGGPARPPVRAGVGGRGGFRPVPPPDRPFPVISPPSGASAGPPERRGERYRTAERCNCGIEPRLSERYARSHLF